MEFDLMVGNLRWRESAELAAKIESAGFSGMVFTETSQTPWMMLQAAAMAAPKLTFMTGIAVAFPRSPMITAQIAWEIAANTGGRFRLGLGSQVRGHIVRRYGATYDRPVTQMRDYIRAVRACLRAFRGEEKLSHKGPYYELNLLPFAWAPPRHDHEHDIRIDLAAVRPPMCRAAGELCDGLHVHPMHSMPYLRNQLLPAVAEGAARSGRTASDIDLIVPVFTVAGDTPEERQHMTDVARTQIAFYGTTPAYSLQFEELGFAGMTEKLGGLMKAGDFAGMSAAITDDVLQHFAVVARWDDMADALRERYAGVARRLVTYLAIEDIQKNPHHLSKWGEVAKAVRRA